MKTEMKQLLTELNSFARNAGVKAEFWLHAEHSHLTRFANSAISLNTFEDTMRLTIVAYRGNARGSFTLVTNPGQREAMHQAILTADENARHATPVDYNLTVSPLTSLPDDVQHFDDLIPALTPEQKLAYVTNAVEGLESDAVVLSGIFASGAVWQATANTLADTVLFHATTDAFVSLVLSHTSEKWEISSSQSASAAADLNPALPHQELSTLLEHFSSDNPIELAPGSYDVVFGREALADCIGVCNWIGFSGGSAKRNMSFLQENQLGRKVFSELLTIVDDPSCAAAFPYAFDSNGLKRYPFPLVEKGVFTSYFWDRDSADEFGQQETGHSVPSMSMTVAPGDRQYASLADIIAMPRSNDILYFPYLHYMNVVNATQGIITGCSRFGALLLKKDGTVAVPYNVRMTESIPNLFSSIEWLSSHRVATNTSSTYGERCPAAMLVPAFVKINNVSITRSNHSF